MLNDKDILKPASDLDGTYIIESLLGKGGMGAVYSARHRENSRKVAIKVLHPSLAAISRIAERFRQEAVTAQSLDHPGICPVLEYRESENNCHYMVMEHLEGNTLHDLMTREVLDTDRLVTITRQILEALEAIHQVGIVHRDLKPENIFIEKCQNGEDRVRLLDFGVAKSPFNPGSSSFSEAGLLLGTPGYMAPEQLTGRSDHRSDLYSLGVILYETCTGELPYKGDTAEELITNIGTKPVHKPRSLNRHLSKPLERLILKSMAADRRLRYNCASDMKRALGEITPPRLDLAA